MHVQIRTITALSHKPIAHLSQAYARWRLLHVLRAFSAILSSGSVAVHAEVDPVANDGLGLAEVVVTASSLPGSKMQQSLSVSTLDADEIRAAGATNTAEILRVIPGVRSESSGGEGNANLTVRGLPISAGGARYVQFQEDGLPILQFGDIAFATADQFLRLDGGVRRVEVVRGGSASTMATNSPGGVVNFLSHTGEQAEGALSVSEGIGFSRSRYDFSYGEPLQSQGAHYFVSGFYRSGESARESDLTTEDGGQLRGNVTRDFDNGYVRLNFKYLNDRLPMAMPVPVSTHDGHISTLPGIDPRSASFYSPSWVKDQTIDQDNNLKRSDVNDGLHVSSRAVGIETSFDLANNVVLEDRMRISDNSGRFIAVFPADNDATKNDFAQAPFTYATGSRAGQPYNGNVFTATVFNVALDDLGNAINELKLHKTFSLFAQDDLVGALGLYHSLQNVALTWQFNQYLLAADGSNPALIANSQTNAAIPGLLFAGSDVWDGCCTRTLDVDYTTTSPFASLVLTHDAWTFDASVRRDNQQASGSFNLAQQTQFVESSAQVVDYDVRKSSYSLGANWQLIDDLALFARQSRGYAFNADRIMFNGFSLDDSVPIPVNEVRQLEGGAKWRWQDLSAFVTYFNATTRETNYEATTQVFTDRKYDAQGVELELAYVSGKFRVSGGATYTDAQIKKAESAQLEGNTPRRQADLMFQIMPRYSLGIVDVGAAFIGSSDAWGDDSNEIKLPGYMIINLFVDVNIDEHTRLSVAANNVADKLAYSEVEGDGHAARAFDGRSIMTSLTYAFD